jgi:SAM-dependent methyltransferase
LLFVNLAEQQTTRNLSNFSENMSQLIIAVKKKFSTVKRIGLFRLLRCYADRQWLGLLAMYFRFDPWHATAPYSCRPYKQTVVDLVNSLSPHTVVEIGCGLGELLCRMHAPRRYGYDVDLGVICAARFLHGSKISFIHGDAAKVEQDSIDVLILVNWIHGQSPAELGGLLKPLLATASYLVLDAIDSDGPASYRYKHDFAFLEGKAERLSVTRPLDEPRSFHLFRVIR